MVTIRSSRTGLALLPILGALVLALASAAPGAAGETALDRYVAKADDTYSWSLVRTLDGDGYTAFVLDLRSQSWRPAQEVDRPVWQHWLTIVRPDTIRYTKALLTIGGGRNGGEPPTSASERSVRFALETASVVADLGMVPNQPLHFADSKDQGRSEDDLIAYSRVKYLVTGDEEWLVRLAMVKSGVRALDAITEFLASAEGGGHPVRSFVVSGGSKRAWTTWLVAAVDPRVEAIVPLVIDALNTEAVTRHHYAAYGFFSPSLGDYVRHGLYPDRLGTPEFRRILEIEDPYQYRERERLAIPKYVINASGDQYFLPDNSRFYFGDLRGEKLLRYVPNAKHDLGGSDAQESMLAFYQSVLDGGKRPRMTWRNTADSAIEVVAVDQPTSVSMWRATNPEARDFRLDVIGKAWTQETLHEVKPGIYLARVSPPPSGFTAFFVELVYPSGGRYPFKATTDVRVVPDVLPFRLEDGKPPWLGLRN